MHPNSSCKGFRASIQATFILNLVLLLAFGFYTAWKFGESSNDARNIYGYQAITVFFAINVLIILRQLVLMCVNYVDSNILKNWTDWLRNDH